MAPIDEPDAGELVELRERNLERLRALSERGFEMPGIGLSYDRHCLEVLLGDRLPIAQMLHEREVAIALDGAEVEAEAMEERMRQEALTKGAGAIPPELATYLGRRRA